MFTDTPVDIRVDAQSAEDAFSKSLQKPHIVIPRAWRVATWLVIAAMVLQLPAPALARASARKVVQQPAAQVAVPFVPAYSVSDNTTRSQQVNSLPTRQLVI